MNVADDVERAVIILAIVPKSLPIDLSLLDFAGVAEHIDIAKALALQPAQRSPQLTNVPANDMRSKIALRATDVSLLTNRFRKIQHDRRRQNVMLARQLGQRPARFLLHVRRVDDRKLCGRKPLGGDVFQNVERIIGRILRILVVAHQPAAKVGGENFRRFEMPARKR